jgi:hypothetical protein
MCGAYMPLQRLLLPAGMCAQEIAPFLRVLGCYPMDLDAGDFEAGGARGAVTVAPDGGLLGSQTDDLLMAMSGAAAQARPLSVAVLHDGCAHALLCPSTPLACCWHSFPCSGTVACRGLWAPTLQAAASTCCF